MGEDKSFAAGKLWGQNSQVDVVVAVVLVVAVNPRMRSSNNSPTSACKSGSLIRLYPLDSGCRTIRYKSVTVFPYLF